MGRALSKPEFNGIIQNLKNYGITYEVKYNNVVKKYNTPFYHISFTAALENLKVYQEDDLVPTFSIVPFVILKLGDISKLYFNIPNNNADTQNNYGKYLISLPFKTPENHYNGYNTDPVIITEVSKTKQTEEPLETGGRLLTTYYGKANRVYETKQYDGDKLYFAEISQDKTKIFYDYYIPLPSLYTTEVKRGKEVQYNNYRNAVIVESIGYFMDINLAVTGYNNYVNIENYFGRAILGEIMEKNSELLKTFSFLNDKIKDRITGEMVEFTTDRFYEYYNDFVVEVKRFKNEPYLLKVENEVEFVKNKLKCTIEKYNDGFNDAVYLNINFKTLGIDYHNIPYYDGAITQSDAAHVQPNENRAIKDTPLVYYDGDYAGFCINIGVKGLQKLNETADNLLCDYLKDRERCLQNFDPSIDFKWKNTYYYSFQQGKNIIFGTGSKKIPLHAIKIMNTSDILGLMNGFYTTWTY